jgi:hypothetical protein
MTKSAQEIKAMLDHWYFAMTADGGLRITDQTESLGLLAQGVKFHDLSFDALIMAIAASTRFVIWPNGFHFGYFDNYRLWAWCAELLIGPNAKHFKAEEKDIEDLLHLCFTSALVGHGEQAQIREEHEARNRIVFSLPVHSRKFLWKASNIAPYLSFPALEAAAKRFCSEYVAYDGSVKKNFTIPGKQEYKPAEAPNTKQCSNIEHYLLLLRDQVADDNLRYLINMQCADIQRISGADAFKTIHRWRNSSLHGSEHYHAIDGAILNMCCLILIYQLKPNFYERKKQALDICNHFWNEETDDWSYYLKW